MSNVKLGNKTLKKNVNLGNNTGLGNESLVENKEGFQNTSVGSLSLNKNLNLPLKKSSHNQK